MKIYAVADIHARQRRLERITANVTRLLPDLLVVAGDLTSYRRSPLVVKHLAELPLPVFAILGNTDRRQVGGQIHCSPGISSDPLPATRHRPFNIVGLNGTLPLPFRSRIALRENRRLNAVAPMVNAHTILVVHTPPWGILDDVMGKFHAGSKNLLEFIRRRKPAVVICGHIHERPGTQQLGNTCIVNCAMGKGCQGALIRFQEADTGRPHVEMLY